MAIITNSNRGTDRADLIQVGNPYELQINDPLRPGEKILLIYGRGGNDIISAPAGYEHRVFIYGDYNFNQGKQTVYGNDIMHVGSDWWAQGGRGADVMQLHPNPGGYKAPAIFRDFNFGAGDKVIASGDPDTFYFETYSIRADPDGRGRIMDVSKIGIVMDAPGDPINDGQWFEIVIPPRLELELEFGERGQPATASGAVEAFIKGEYGDWMF